MWIRVQPPRDRDAIAQDRSQSYISIRVLYAKYSDFPLSVLLGLHYRYMFQYRNKQFIRILRISATSLQSSKMDVHSIPAHDVPLWTITPPNGIDIFIYLIKFRMHRCNARTSLIQQTYPLDIFLCSTKHRIPATVSFRLHLRGLWCVTPIAHWQRIYRWMWPWCDPTFWWARSAPAESALICWFLTEKAEGTQLPRDQCSQRSVMRHEARICPVHDPAWCVILTSGRNDKV